MLTASKEIIVSGTDKKRNNFNEVLDQVRGELVRVHI